jgi:hypothetical protein
MISDKKCSLIRFLEQYFEYGIELNLQVISKIVFEAKTFKLMKIWMDFQIVFRQD